MAENDFRGSKIIDGDMFIARKRGLFKKAVPDVSLAQRFDTDYKFGLTEEQVGSRIAQGFVNSPVKPVGKTYASIFFRNIFTAINLLVFVTAIALVATGVDNLPQYFFLLIVVANIIIGIVQEIRTKRAVGRLNIVTAPRATVVREGERKVIELKNVVLDDIVYLDMGRQINADSIVVKGEIEVNESLLTGESVPVLKKFGDTLYSGSFVSGGNCYARVNQIGGQNYIDKLSSNVVRYKKPKSELQDSVRNIIRVILLLLVPITAFLMWRSIDAHEGPLPEAVADAVEAASGAVIGMIPAGMFLLTSVALAVSMMRLAKKKTLVKDLFGIEMLARVNVLCLDKTGTITDGTMTVKEVVELHKHTEEDELTTEQIIGNLLTATGDNNQTALAFVDKFGYKNDLKIIKALPFSSIRKLSAATFEGHGTYIIGAPEYILKEPGVRVSKLVQDFAKNGYRVMLLAHATGNIKDDKLPPVKKPLAVIAIEDHIRKDAPDTIKWFRENNVAVKVISGDNAITVSEVAKRAGVEKADLYVSMEGMSNQEVVEAASKYTVFGRVSPEQKSLLIRSLKAKGNTVAMTGDGVNDLLAMREADCSIAIANGSEAARKVSHLVLSDNSFSTMPEVVKEGRRVVNNIQKASTLFLMKTFMSLGLAIITIVRSFIPGVDTMDYPFTTANLLLLEMFIIGIPSFFLALQTNKNIITGRFIFNIIQKSIPSGLALIINIMAVYIFAENMFAPGTPGSVGSYEFTTMIVMALTFTGMIMLVKLAEPLDVFRGILVVACNLACFLILFIAPWFVGATYIQDLDAVMILFIISTVLASYFMVAVIIKILSKVKIYT